MENLQGKIKRTLLSTIIALTLGTIATQQIVLAGNQSAVSIGSSSLSFAANSSESELELSIAGPGMDVVSVRSSSSIYWDIPNDIADGTYNYELNIVIPDDGKEENAKAERIHGTFEVINGIIRDNPDDGSASIENIKSSTLEKVVIAVLDFIIPSANAANLVADAPANSNVKYKNGGATKWMTQSMSIAGSNDDAFRTRSYWSGKTVQLLEKNARFHIHNSINSWALKTAAVSPNFAGIAPYYLSIHSNANNSLIGDSNGNVSLADSSVFIDKANNRVGIGTTTPTHEIQIDSISPTILFNDTNGDTDWSLNRLSSASWFDISAKNGADPAESKFLVHKDAKAHSLKVLAGGVNIGADGTDPVKLGIGTELPSVALHIKQTDAALTVEDSNPATAVRNVVKLKNNGGVGFQLEDTSNTNKWEFRTGGSGAFLISDVNVGGAKMLMNSTGLVKMGKNVAAASNAWNLELDADGDLHIAGNMFVSGTQLSVPDYVFADDYKLMPLDELQNFVQKEKHLPNIASEAEVKKAKAVNVGKSQMRHLEKIEELTLYTLQQHQEIKALREKVEENTKLKNRLATVEKLVTNLASATGHLSKTGSNIALK